MATTVNSNVLLRVKSTTYPAIYVFNAPYTYGDCPLFGGLCSNWNDQDSSLNWSDGNALSIKYYPEDDSNNGIVATDQSETVLVMGNEYEIRFYDSCVAVDN